MVSPTNIHFRIVSSETGQYVKTEFRMRLKELVSGYSSMDVLSL